MQVTWHWKSLWEALNITQMTLKMKVPPCPQSPLLSQGRNTPNSSHRDPYLFTEGNSHLRLHPGVRRRKKKCSRHCSALTRLLFRSDPQMAGSLLLVKVHSCQLTWECLWLGPTSTRGGWLSANDWLMQGPRLGLFPQLGKILKGLPHFLTGVSPESSPNKPNFSHILNFPSQSPFTENPWQLPFQNPKRKRKKKEKELKKAQLQNLRKLDWIVWFTVVLLKYASSNPLTLWNSKI